jgi:hypothetical protein
MRKGRTASGYSPKRTAWNLNPTIRSLTYAQTAVESESSCDGFNLVKLVSDLALI